MNIFKRLELYLTFRFWSLVIFFVFLQRKANGEGSQPWWYLRLLASLTDSSQKQERLTVHKSVLLI